MSNKVLSQKEIDMLLKKIDDIKVSDTLKKIDKARKIKICDFERPDILGKESMRILSEIMNNCSVQLTDYLQHEYEIRASIHLASVDQVTRKEFIFSVPSGIFALCSDWLGGHVILNMNPDTFLSGFLKRLKSKRASFGLFEQKIFMNFLAESFLNEIYHSFNAKSDEILLQPQNIRFESNRMFLPYTESPVEMGILITFEIQFADRKNCNFPIDLFLNSTVIEALCGKNIIFHGDKLKAIPIENPLGNLVVEIGRCHITDNFIFEKNQVLELNTDIKKTLSIFLDDKKYSSGEALYMDDSRAVRLVETEISEELTDTESFYNIRVVWGSVNVTQEEINGFGEGAIIELSENWMSPVYIYRRDLSDGKEKLCALGKVYMLYERLAVKVTQVI